MIEEQNSKEGYIIDFISGELVKATPEEIQAVQVYSKILVEDYGYPIENIQTRPQFRVKGSPSDTSYKFPIDIVVFKTRFALFVTNVSYTDNISTVAGTIINTPGSFANIIGDPRDNEALDNELSRIDAALENVDIELAAINANIGYISDRLTQINGE